jgi:hypothetical protein
MRGRSVIGKAGLAACVVALLVPASAAAAPRVTPVERRAINATLDAFVNHAVKRSDVAAAYGTVTPGMRNGRTPKAWSTGEIPVYPYPARGKTFHEWNVLYRTKEEVALELILRPREGSKLGAILFHVYLSPMRDGRWLVNSFMPAATFAPEGKRPQVVATNDFLPQAQGEGKPAGSGRVSDLVAYVPFALIGLLFAALVGVALFAALRDRRFARTGPRTLPPLSMRGDGARTRPGHGP